MFMEKKGRMGLSKLSFQTFLSHSTETFRRGSRKPSVPCSRKKLVAKKCMDKNEVSITVFRRKLFCHSAKNKIFVVEPFSLSFFSGME